MRKSITGSFGLIFVGMVMTAIFPACNRSDTSRSRSQAKRAAQTPYNFELETEDRFVNEPGKIKTALLLVDVQNDFFDHNVARVCPDFQENIAALLNDCRSEKIEVIHIRTEISPNPSKRLAAFQFLYGKNMPCISGTAGVLPLPCARATRSEKVFLKNSFDAFQKQELEIYLRRKGINHVLVAGLTTDVCVMSTCFSSVNAGFLTTIVADCCGAGHPTAQKFITERYEGLLFHSITRLDIRGQKPVWEEKFNRIEFNFGT